MTSETIDAADAPTEIVSGKEATRARKETNGVVTCTVTVNSGDPTDIRISRAKSVTEVSVPQPIPNVFPLFPRGDPLYAVIDGDSGDIANVETRVGRTVGEASNAYVRATTYSIEAESTAEANADQTGDVNAGETVTSTIRAASGEIWDLTQVLISAAGTGTASGTQQHTMTVETEKEGIELGIAEYPEDSDMAYKSGNWLNTPNTSRGINTDIRIDATDGLQFKYKAVGEAQTNDRTIRASFDVIKTK